MPLSDISKFLQTSSLVLLGMDVVALCGLGFYSLC
jgi:hypothetical protein